MDKKIFLPIIGVFSLLRRKFSSKKKITVKKKETDAQ